MTRIFVQPFSYLGSGQAIVALLKQHSYGVVVGFMHCALLLF